LRNGLIVAQGKVKLWTVVNMTTCQVPLEARNVFGFGLEVFSFPFQ